MRGPEDKPYRIDVVLECANGPTTAEFFVKSMDEANDLFQDMCKVYSDPDRDERFVFWSNEDECVVFRMEDIIHIGVFKSHLARDFAH